MAQKWLVYPQPDGSYSLISAWNSKAIDLRNGGRTNGTAVQQFSYNGSRAQKFNLQNVPDYQPDRSPIHYEIEAFSSNYVQGKNEFPLVSQLGVLPSGCETVALTNVLRYMGYQVDPRHMADRYLSYSAWDYIHHFVGNPRQLGGIGGGVTIYPPGLVETANRFLREKGDSRRAYDISGRDFFSLYENIEEEIPVMIWTSLHMSEPNFQGSLTDKGKTYYNFPEIHCVVLYGYDKANHRVAVSDPTDGRVFRPEKEFQRIYDKIGRFAMIIK